MVLFLTLLLLTEQYSPALALAPSWAQPGAGGDYRLSSLNWVSTGMSDKDQCQPAARHRNAGPVGWGSLCLWQVLAQPTTARWKTCTDVLYLRAVQVLWKGCSELGRKTWLWLTRDNESWWQHSLSMFSCGSSHRVARQAPLCTEVREDNLELYIFLSFLRFFKCSKFWSAQAHLQTWIAVNLWIKAEDLRKQTITWF